MSSNKSQSDKSIETLAVDIYTHIRTKGYVMSKPLVKELPPEVAAGEPQLILRASSIGKCVRQLWFASQNPEDLTRKIDTPPSPLDFKFLYGDLIEQVVIDLAKATGHTVTHEQEEIVLDGITGHCDCAIDGVIVDIKSASDWAFRKYVQHGINHENDSFGYIEQLQFYKEALGFDRAGWIFVNKVTGEIAFVEMAPYAKRSVKPLINNLKKVVQQPNPNNLPRLPDEVDGKYGNRAMNTICSRFCQYRDECWSDPKTGKKLYRTFMYSNGAKDLTVVKRVPSVPEITNINEGMDF